MLPDRWFTIETFGTVGGAGLFTTLVTSTLYQVFEFNPRKTSFFVSSILVFAIYFVQGPSLNVLEWIITFGNACLIYATAIGMNIGGNEAAKRVKKVPTPGDDEVEALASPSLLPRFLERWF